MDQYANIWQGGLLVAGAILVLQMLASAHILRHKDDVRAAVGWIGLVWLAPVFGLIFYLLFGINRIERQAKRARMRRGRPARRDLATDPDGPTLYDAMPDAANRWHAHSRLAGRVTGLPLTLGNKITPLGGGRAAYDAMLDAIEKAEHTIALTTYIFQADQAGRKFVSALARAHERGVEVRVLVDAVGNLYGLKPVSNLLRRRNIPVATFNPARLSWRLAFFNLRTHRKLLIVDGLKGFAGGMNIRKHHLENEDGTQRVRDTHFSLEGPIVSQMMEAFADDWAFSTREELPEEKWLPRVSPTGAGIPARAVPDGPDEPRQRSAMIMESALASARKRVQVITPYFLPEQALVTALKQAALRGVEVDILVPAKNNLPLFMLTALSGARQLVDAGCRLFLSAPPFDHTKLMIVDDDWVFFGSSNWDARSLKLNFEFNVESYDRGFATAMSDWVHPRFEAATEMTREDFRTRPRLQRAFGRVLWLASPYL
ncbi:phospholipase D-like domain-containing protein [Kordiimonas gwangyangensis]|uniref:phospholipase D-like domain-containing protein n=3 Tax=Kordiimonas gwangyangensis TaxID=288022 RepID=UPI0003625BB4|nr:phospholipase D-like domain-containing protein [Kordiimonas gwangyangensis]